MRAFSRVFRLGSRLAGLLVIAAVCGGLLPAGVAAAAADPSAGFDVGWAVTGADGQPRTDGRIAVGDDIAIDMAAVDGTAFTVCRIRLVALGGWMMETPGNLAAGRCGATIRIPDFPYPIARAGIPADDPTLDLCVWPFAMEFADGQARALIAEDRLQPGERQCSNASTGTPNNLDFPIEPGGNPRPFVSDPPMVSWNPADWGTDMQPLRFGTSWHLELPTFVTRCYTYLNGEWLTVIRPRQPDGCVAWDVRIPGVLPSAMRWEGGPGAWYVEIVASYTGAGGGLEGQTISAMSVPFEDSDGVFVSDPPSIFPTELAATRFVTAGAVWRPAFQVSGGTATDCTLTRYTVPVGFPVVPMITEDSHADADADGVCTFDVPPLTDGEHHQYYVTADLVGLPNDPNMTFGGDISGIPAPQPPVIDPPTDGVSGQTEIGVDPGAGQGLAVDLAVAHAPASASGTSSTARSGALAPASSGGSAATTTPVCADRAISSDLQYGGAIPHLDATCSLAPGDYIATARMVDAAGIVTTSQRAFTVTGAPSAAPAVTSRTPTATTNVPRNVRPAATFDMGVTGVTGSNFRLRDIASGVYVAAAVIYDPATRRATLRPGALLGVGRTYRASLGSSITNTTGQALAALSWTFRVTTDGTRPAIAARSPGRSATGVSRTANLKIRFSEAVQGVSATTLRLKNTVSGQFVAAVVTYDKATNRATINPSVTLRGGRRYIVYATSGIGDLAGNRLTATSWSFMTR